MAATTTTIVGSWSVGAWGPCTRVSGQTSCSMTRSLQCVSVSGAMLPSTSCPSGSVPPTSQICACSTCADLALTRFVLNGRQSTCAEIRGYCADPTYGTSVQQDCPQTCGKCLTAVCGDKAATRFSFGGGVAATCADISGYCQDPSIGAQVRADCPLTCNACGCADKSVTRFQLGGQPATCSQLQANGYCTDSAYSKQVGQDCPVSCGTCSPASSAGVHAAGVSGGDDELVVPPQRYLEEE